MAEKYVTVLDSDKRTPEMKAWAQANDKKVHKMLMKRMRSVPGNKVCADCTAKQPGWAALPHGIHICINCAQIHRRIGRHISQVKAINTGTYLWHKDEVHCMQAMGNVQAQRLYLAGGRGNPKAPPKPNASDSVTKKEAYIRDVYEHHKYVNPDFSLAAAPKKHAKKRQQQPPAPVPAPLLNFDVEPATAVAPAASATKVPVLKQPAVYSGSGAPAGGGGQQTIGPAGDDVDFFSLFDMKASAPQQHKQQQHSSPGNNNNFDDILSLYH